MPLFATKPSVKEHRHPEITMQSFLLADYLKFASKGDWEQTAELLLRSVNKVAWTEGITSDLAAL